MRDAAVVKLGVVRIDTSLDTVVFAIPLAWVALATRIDLSTDTNAVTLFELFDVLAYSNNLACDFVSANQGQDRLSPASALFLRFSNAQRVGQ